MPEKPKQCEQDDPNLVPERCREEAVWTFPLLGKPALACSEHLPGWVEKPKKVKKGD